MRLSPCCVNGFSRTYTGRGKKARKDSPLSSKAQAVLEQSPKLSD